MQKSCLVEVSSPSHVLHSFSRTHISLKWGATGARKTIRGCGRAQRIQQLRWKGAGTNFSLWSFRPTAIGAIYAFLRPSRFIVVKHKAPGQEDETNGGAPHDADAMREPDKALSSSAMFPSTFVPTKTVFASPEAGSVAESTVVFALHHPPPQPSENVLLLLHGYPQNHTLWHEVVAELEKHGVLSSWHILIPDLPGYGQSRKVASPDGSHSAHSKRAVAADMVTLVDNLIGPGARFVVAGHDRGARVGYRLAKDFPDRVRGLCVQDIVPGRLVFQKMRFGEGRHAETARMYHWIFLALPSPLPETMIAASSHFYFAFTIDSWTGTRWKGKFNPEAMASWVNQYNDHAVITGALEDYRAGASIDLDHDEEDEKAGKEAVLCPLLVLSSVHLTRRFDVGEIWKGLSTKGVKSVQVGDGETGHFLPVEAAKETTEELVTWLSTL